jgi:MFS family permease
MVLFGLQDIMQDASMNFTPNTINWVIVAYTITFATFLGIAGYMGDRLGPRLIFVVGSLLLAISNAICAWGTNQSSLLAGRALAGIGAALTVSCLSFLVTESNKS